VIQRFKKKSPEGFGWINNWNIFSDVSPVTANKSTDDELAATTFGFVILLL